jgi:hypothetical protein
VWFAQMPIQHNDEEEMNNNNIEQNEIDKLKLMSKLKPLMES